MATCWHKPAYTAEDRDPATHEILPGAMPPGIYCEDEATYQEILSKGDARLDYASLARSEEDRPCGWFAHTIGGIRIRVATPMELVVLRGVKRIEPVEPPYSVEEISAKVKALMDRISADEHARVQALQGQVTTPDGKVERLISDGTRREKVSPHPMRIPAGMNRAAKRRAASRGRA